MDYFLDLFTPDAFKEKVKNWKNKHPVATWIIFIVALLMLLGIPTKIISGMNFSDHSDEVISSEDGFEDTPSSTTTTTTTTTSSTSATTKSTKYPGIGEVSRGKYTYLGEYPQSSSSSKEAIKWRVLKIENGKALLISDMLLDCVKYNSNKSVTWENSYIRKWLNGEFINKAFSESEIEMIYEVTNFNPSNSVFGTDGGRSTSDKVFLLSEEEAEAYFGGNDDRKCVATNYAKSHGSAINEKETDKYGRNTSWWWLRTPGEETNYAAHVRGSGEIYPSGSIVSYAKGSVRPAMWVYM